MGDQKKGPLCYKSFYEAQDEKISEFISHDPEEITVKFITGTSNVVHIFYTEVVK